MTYPYVRHDRFTHVLAPQLSLCVWLCLCVCDVAHSCVTWLIHMWHDSFIWETRLIREIWPIRKWDTTHSFLFYLSFLCGEDTTQSLDEAGGDLPINHVHTSHSYVRHGSFISETWLTYTADNTHSYVCHDPFIHVTWLIRTSNTRDMTHSHHQNTALWLPTTALHHTKTWHHCHTRIFTDEVQRWCRAPGLQHTRTKHQRCTTSGDAPFLPHSYMWHDSFIRVTWLIRTTKTRLFRDQSTALHRAKTWRQRCTALADAPFGQPVWYHRFIRVTWLSHMGY